MIILWMDRVVRKLGFVSSFQKSFIYLICNSLLLIGRKWRDQSAIQAPLELYCRDPVKNGKQIKRKTEKTEAPNPSINNCDQDLPRKIAHTWGFAKCKTRQPPTRETSTFVHLNRSLMNTFSFRPCRINLSKGGLESYSPQQINIRLEESCPPMAQQVNANPSKHVTPYQSIIDIE